MGIDRRFGTVVCVFALVCLSSAQDLIPADPQPETPLGDRARQARNERTGASDNPSRAQQLATALENQKEEQIPVPFGYKTFTVQELPYALAVPDTTQLNSRDGRGVLLSSGSETGPNITIILGDPVLSSAGSPENKVGEVANRWVKCYPRGRNSINGHAAEVREISPFSRCRYGNLMGSAAFIADGDNVYPILCGYEVTPAEMEPRTLSNRKRLDKLSEPAIGSGPACDRVIQSVRFRQGPKWSPPATPRVAPNAASLGTSSEPISEGEVSLGRIARETKQAARSSSEKHVVDETNLASSSGIRRQFRYCSDYECYTASATVPKQADCDPSGGVYCTVGDPTSSLLFSAGVLEDFRTDPWEDEESVYQRLAATTKFYSAPRAISVKGEFVNLDSQTTERTHVAGRPALVRRRKWARGPVTVLNVSAAVATPGKVAYLTCESGLANFSEAACDAFFDSLRIER